MLSGDVVCKIQLNLCLRPPVLSKPIALRDHCSDKIPLLSGSEISCPSCPFISPEKQILKAELSVNN